MKNLLPLLFLLGLTGCMSSAMKTKITSCINTTANELAGCECGQKAAVNFINCVK